LEDSRISENRVGSTKWCLCNKCAVESQNIDCPCCQEQMAIIENKFEKNTALQKLKNLMFYVYENQF